MNEDTFVGGGGLMPWVAATVFRLADVDPMRGLPERHFSQGVMPSVNRVGEPEVNWQDQRRSVPSTASVAMAGGAVR